MTDARRSIKHAHLSSLPTRRYRTAAAIVRAFPFRPGFDFMEDRTLLSSFLVSNTGDSGPGSLRQAIIDSDNAVGATNTIDFDISGTGVQTIAPLSSLPVISNPVLMDGTSQPGYAGTPLIELNGGQAGGGDGLLITAPNVTIRGLDIDSFSQGAGIHLTGTGATGDWIYGNFLGTDPTGTQADPNKVGGEIDGGAANNLIGTNGDGINDAAERNLISGNLTDGVAITGADSNLVTGNDIGTDVTTTHPLGNADIGVLISFGASDNWIGVNPDGGSAIADEGNVISGNGIDGVNIVDANSNAVAGNKIGTDGSGGFALPNDGNGVVLVGSASDNTIGGTTAGAGNLISQNSGAGVAVENTSAGDAILENSIYANSGQAIDLNDDGVTPNATSPRQGPNNLQNFPVIVTMAGGELEGWLGGSTPNTPFDIEVYASDAYNADGSGEAQDYLGSLQVTTNATGQASFSVPFTAAAGLPIITATATDPEGNTSEVSAQRQASVQAPATSLRDAPNQPLILTSASGDGLAIEDPDAGPLDPLWNVTLSVSAGTLTLSTAALLSGSGNGTGSLSYSGPLSALNAALDGMTFTPPAGPHVFAMLALDAQSDGAQPVDAQLAISDGVFIVDTTADSGPGSLRQAILDSNAATGGSNTIEFEIPGNGVHTIEPLSSLPAITQSVLINGASQRGYGSTPLVAISASPAGNDSTLGISGADVTLQGVMERGFTFGAGGPRDFLVVPSVSPAGGVGGVDSYRFDTTSGEEVSLIVHPTAGLTTRLAVADSEGQVLMTSDGQSSANGDQVIQLYLAAGSYVVNVSDLEGAGTYALTAALEPANQPLQPLPVGLPGSGILVPTGQEAVAGDFTGDGDDDLAIAIGDDVSVFLSNGDGTFQPPVTYPVGGLAISIVAADFTGNGRLDLAVANQESNAVSVLLGNGDGTFQPSATYAVGQIPTSVAVGDFTGNGRLDLAVANGGDNTASILLNEGDGTFESDGTYAVGFYPDAIVTGDFTGDGHIDLAVAYAGNNIYGTPDPGGVSILLGNGDGTFQAAQNYAAGPNPSAIVAGDFTGSGRLDLAVADMSGLWEGAGTTSSGGVSMLLGNGDGTFQPAVNYSAGVFPDGIVAGEFTGSGHLDLAVASYESAAVSVLLGNGDGTFEAPANYALGELPASLVAGDFTGDGHLDLAVMSQNEDSVSLLLGRGDGTFEPLLQVGNPAGASPFSIVAGDFTGDGRTDVAVADSGDQVSVLLGNGDGTFQHPLAATVDENPNDFIDSQSIVAGDFNGDGRLDLAVPNQSDNTVSVLLGDGDGTFQAQVTYVVGQAPDAIAEGDFTGDGHLDLVVANFFSNTVSVLLGNGDGTFQPQVTYPVGQGPDALVVGDFRGDGRLDIAVANDYDNTVSVLLGNGDGTFQPQVTYAIGEPPSAILAGEFSANGHVDLAVAYVNYFGSGDGGVAVLLGNGEGAFQPAVDYPVGSFPDAIAAGDFSGNGHLDLAVANGFDNTLSVLVGNGDGTFQPQVVYPVGQYPGAIVTGDFNQDGRVDLAIANQLGSNVTVLLGNSDGTFTDADQVVSTPHATPVVADVNGDGTDDTLVVDGSGDILYRQGIPGRPGTFEPPVTVNPPLPGGSNPYTSRDIAWVPNTMDGPLLASVDAEDDAVSLYAYRNGGLVRIGSLTTGQLPAQIIAADLNGTGWDDLVVRNAGDGTLSVFFAKTSIGPIDPQDNVPAFLPPVTLSVGVGDSDVQAVDTTGSGTLDLVVTNKLTGQVSILYNLGNGTFARPVPFRAGTGLSAVDPGSTPEVASLEATAGVAAGSFTTGGLTGLVTINPGSDTLGVLAGLGGGRFANPVTIQTQSPAQVVRMGDFTGNGLDDLAVLTADGLSIYLANGQGGFLPPTTYAVPPESDGLTVTDLTGNGKLDLLVGDAYGDVLVLLGNGNGSFQPYHDATQSIELAVADLTGNGSKDIIYADQGLDRVVVDYGAGNSAVLANQSTGLLDPGAVALADLNGDGIPDLIVANSGSNNVLIYPGLGNGQFGPAINDGNGYFVGTNPVGITVHDLTGQTWPDGQQRLDLVVADKGSDQVSILLNQSQQGGAISFSAGPRLNSGGIGPVSTVVGNFTGGKFPDLLVTNSQSNDVKLLPGVGQGFFDDTNPRPYSVGTDPGPTFVGNFNGQADLVTVNAGSNDLTLIAGFNGPDPVTTTISSAGLDPATAFAFSSDTGFDNLVVGNGGDGVLVLFEGSSAGLTLSASETVSGLPSPSSLAFASLSGGQVQFYAATQGQEAAALVALSLGGGEISAISALASPASSGVAQLVPLQESSLALVGTLLTLTIDSSAGETEALAAIAVSAAAPASLGQSIGSRGLIDGLDGDGNDLQPVAPDDPGARQGIPTAPAWQRYTLGTDEAIDRFDREHPDLSPGNNDKPKETSPGDGRNEPGSAPREGSDLVQSWVSAATHALRAKAADRVIDLICGDERLTVARSWWRQDATVWAGVALAAADPIATAQATCSALLRSLAVYSHTPDLAGPDEVIPLLIHRIPDGGWALSGRHSGERMAAAVSLVLASVGAGYVYLGPSARRGNLRNRWLGACPSDCRRDRKH